MPERTKSKITIWNASSVIQKMMTGKEHILDCIELGEKLRGRSITNEKIEYEDLFENVAKQKQITQIYREL